MFAIHTLFIFGRYNSLTMQFTHFKYMMQCFLVYSQVGIKFLVQRSYLILEDFSSLMFNSKWLILVNSETSLVKDSH